MDRGRRIEFISQSQEETIALGQQLGSTLRPGSIVCLFGDLGAGKTTFIKGLVNALTGVEPHEVCSPTFAYLNIYEGATCVYHFDLYRLPDEAAFLSLGFEEYLFSSGVCCIEWSERIAKILPAHTLLITLTYGEEGERKIVYEPISTF